MNVFASSIELEAISSRTRKTIGFSVAVHALILLWLVLYRTVSPPAPALTEISWIDPASISPPKPAVTVKPARRSARREIPSPKQKPEHFVRKTNTSDFAPQPQHSKASQDKIRRKLASMEKRAVKSNTRIAGIAEAKSLSRPRLAGLKEEAGGEERVSMHRSEDVSTPAVLARSEPASRTPAMKLTEVPEKKVRQAKIETGESAAKRIIDGAKLVGPVADRPLISYGMPEYPEWAKRDGVEAAVNLYFIVLPDGRIKENILVQKTSGFSEFDERAVSALRNWRFEPLKGGATGEQWGSITFNFRLSG